VRIWIRDHNRQVKTSRRGVRLLLFPSPIKNPWLNPIEPSWRHTKRRVIELSRQLGAFVTPWSASIFTTSPLPRSSPDLALALAGILMWRFVRTGGNALVSMVNQPEVKPGDAHGAHAGYCT